VQTRKARQLYAMLDGMGCRAVAVRRYFGETDAQACGQCDLCLTPPQSSDATQAAQKALAAVHRLGERYGRGRVVDHLLGKTKDPHPNETALSTWGIGGELDAHGWRDLIEQLLFEGLLQEQPNDGRPLLMLGPPDEVRAVYKGARRLQVRIQPERKRTRAARQGRAADALEVRSDDRALFEALRAWRKQEASLQGLPPYVIFHDKTLAEIARVRPGALSALAECGGVGQGKLERYGRAVMDILTEAAQPA
jgi:ATP-dependent DNA helicase RecQ